MKVIPIMAVDSSHTRNVFRLPRVSAAYASTMLMLLISRTNVLTDVTGMSNTSMGSGPDRLSPL